MYRFESRQTHNLFSILKRQFYKIAFSILALLVLDYFLHNYTQLKPHNYWTALIISEIIYLIKLVSEDFINKIEINPTAKKIYFEYYAFTVGSIEREFAFDDLKMEVYTARKEKIEKLDFYDRKKQLFYLSEKKDKFSGQSLQEIKEIMENNVKTLAK